MRVKGATVQQFLLALALLAGVCWNLAEAAELRGIELRSGATGTRAELRLDRESSYQLISLSAPERLVVDLPGARTDKALRLPTPSGLVRAVRSGQPAPGTLRIVFDLASPVVALKPHFEPGPDGARLVLEWPGDGATPAIASSAGATTAAPQPVTTAPITIPAPGSTQPAPAQSPAATPTPGDPGIAQAPASPTGPASPSPTPVKTLEDIARRGGMRPLVIAIDAGHGGQDTGALGGDGTREKDVTLAIARELARQVDATPGLKAYLTRDSDYFIPLPQRARKAHAARADIFISVHADSFTSPDARGAGVFVLSTRGASSQRARWLADKENAADVIGGDRARSGDSVLTSVLLDLTQSGNMKVSEDAAGSVLGNLDAIGNLHKGEVERANFAVLRTSDNMPAMLVETGFISNPDEERRLRAPQYQAQLARAILDGVTGYFTRQPPPGTLYAARAEAASAGTGGTGASGGSR
ncbi:MAG TPA: N-acetylmuramoyl-L-alanine amidase [Xanthomonadaceae bacterium]|nr:N-acetylmuramoyl-L-alanine amidase [Xanthomonadaceae bacterium]